MGGWISALCPHVRPLERSIGAPWSPLMPARSYSARQPTDALVTTDNLTQWDPYSGGDNLDMFAGDSPKPLPTRPAIGVPYITPLQFWDVSEYGTPAGWPIVAKTPSGARYYVFGFHTPGQGPWGGLGHLGVKTPTPPVPPPMPFLGYGQ